MLWPKAALPGGSQRFPLRRLWVGNWPNVRGGHATEFKYEAFGSKNQAVREQYAGPRVPLASRASLRSPTR